MNHYGFQLDLDDIYQYLFLSYFSLSSTIQRQLALWNGKLYDHIQIYAASYVSRYPDAPVMVRGNLNPVSTDFDKNSKKIVMLYLTGVLLI